MNKIYQSIRDLELHTNVMIDNKPFSVSFTGGSMAPQRINGKFGTTDPKLQKALEADSGFNKTFKLLEEVKTTKKGSDGNGGNDDLTEVPEVETNQQAQEYLKEKFPEKDLQTSKMKTNALVEEVANSLGLTFPNL
jgi:hypothetical protein